MEFRRLLVPHDFSPHADRALRTALDLLPASGGDVLVLHVISPVPPASELPLGGMAPYIDPKELSAAAQKQLDGIVKAFAARHPETRFRAKTELGSPADRIVDAARGRDAIVMSTAGRTGLAHLLIGSVAERVVRHATVPVLTLRPAAGRTRKARR